MVRVFHPQPEVAVQGVSAGVHESDITDLIVGQSPALCDVIRIVRQVSHYPTTTVLLQGECGTGKDVVARAIHRLSYQGPSPFVALNCAAIPEALLESELFGAEAGAFTDAKATRDGYVARADQGTLFLDEIGAMPLVLQAKLLRFLETLTFRRVGGTRELQVHLRIISATNEDLLSAVAEKRFREDLYYRLKVITITLPPLRERREDIEPLSLHFLQEEGQKRGVTFHLSSEALAVLRAYSWPGNVRQLRNVIERACILCNDLTIYPADLADILLDLQQAEQRRSAVLRSLPQQLQLPPDGIALPALLKDIEHTLIQQALEKCDGNQVRAAALLGLSRDQLRYRLTH